MAEKEIEIHTPDGTSDGVLYFEDGHRRPGVIFLTDIGGIRASQRQMAQRVAEAGYAVLMPNVFYRIGRPPMFDFPFKIGDERFMKRVGELSGPLTPDAVERDVGAYVDFLAAQDSVGGGKLGVVGFCFSGAVSLRTAAARPERIGAAASFHGGRLFTDSPDSPHLLLPRVKASLYFGHAVEDRSMPAEAIDKLNGALEAWGGEFESEVYEGAHHGWTVPDHPAYNLSQAERAFATLTELFAKALR